jgi:creatinine amidohydrolase/Fe(II)-dependent formamide hydrolase-like protein
MPEKYADVRYELLRPAQIKARREAAPIAYIVAGSLEWHGWQNPLGTDSLKAHAICCTAAQRYGGVVLPPFYQGLLGMANWGPQDWEGYTLGFNEEHVFEAAMRGVTRALVEAGWKVLVGVTGHDVYDQRGALQRAIEASGAAGFACFEGDFHTPTAEIPVEMDHAGAWETSVMLAAYPEQANLDDLRARCVSTGDDFQMSAPEGIGGQNPLLHASAELGERIISTCADQIGMRAAALL